MQHGHAVGEVAHQLHVVLDPDQRRRELVPRTQQVTREGRPGTAQKTIRATVAPAPYKKDNRRLDVSTLVPTVNG